MHLSRDEQDALNAAYPPVAPAVAVEAVRETFTDALATGFVLGFATCMAVGGAAFYIWTLAC